jgi:signal transduction histidine kinase
MFFERIKAASRSLRFRLMLWNIAAAVFTAFAILLAVREGVRYTLLHEMNQVLREDLAEIRLYFESPGTHKISELREELNRKARGHNYHGWFAQFTDAEGQRIWATQNAPALPPLTKAQIESGTFESGQYRLRAEELPGISDAAEIACVGCNEQFVARAMTTIDSLVVKVGAAVLLIAPIGGFLLAGRTTRILAHLIQKTAKLRPDELGERLPIRGSGDELDAMAGTINGLLDRIAAYLQRKHDFLANAAHELRTPLAAIRSSVEVALDGKRSENEYRELLDEVIDQCSALQLLVNQLLLLAESDVDPRDFPIEPIQLDELVRRAVDMFQGVAEFRSIRLTADELKPVTVAGNRHHLRQVLNNLLDNAIKFTADRHQTGEPGQAIGDQSGRIQVHLERDERHSLARLTIADNGAGIDAMAIPLVFDRFYRGEKSRFRKGGPFGSGLGLSICQAIVAAHQGTIEVASEVEQGTTVTITLPLARSEPTAG